MKYQRLRKILTHYYQETLPQTAAAFKEKIFAELDAFDAAHPGLNAYQLKAEQYRAIADGFEPVLLEEVPFFYEMGTMVAICDGKYDRGAIHANGWLYMRNCHLFREEQERFELWRENIRANLFSQSSPFVDILHFGIPMEKIFRGGLKSVHDELVMARGKCRNQEETDFIACAMAGIDALHTMQDKFALVARKQGLTDIAKLAEGAPWHAPKSFMEGLNTLAFMRKALGSLEGVGFNTFGRPDVLLKDLYEQDMAKGISKEELYDAVCRFMLIWDCAVDRREKMTGWNDYEYENTFTLGGCDKDGNPVWNDVTRMFLDAQNELSTLYPKIMYRYSEASPEAYLEAIGKSTLDSRSLGLYENDDCMIPALVENGCTLEDARNYVVGGCWDAITPECNKRMSGEYLNILRPLEWSIHQPMEDMERNKMIFSSYEDAESFEVLYERYLRDVYRVMHRKASLVAEGAKAWPSVSPVGAVSALTACCIENRRDITAGGAKYNWECMYFTGFPDVVDALLAIKELCFEQKICTLRELFEACRNNWPDEVLRRKAVRASSYGDSTEKSIEMAARLNDDLYRLSRDLPVIYGGQYHVGHNQYTEIILYGEKMAATPNGRHTGDYISHGITPSRLNKGRTVPEIFYTVSRLGLNRFSGNSILTLQLPAGRMDSKIFSALLRTAAKSGVQAMQLNCVKKEDLLKAQKEPENFGHIIVRVCGFSAPFVLLSEKYQTEFLSRNFSDV